MGNTPTAEAEQLRSGIMARFLFVNAMREMWQSIGRAASYCPKGNTRRHRFSGHPRSKTRCKSCGVPRFREE